MKKGTGKEKVNASLKKYFKEKSTPKFMPGQSLVRYSGAIYDYKEIHAFVDSLLDGWFGVGLKADTFERQFAQRIQSKYGVYTNSGSSANLLAVSSLKSQKMGNRQLKDNDEVIAQAFCFPTTISPLLLNHLKIRFIDSELGSYSMDPKLLEKAITPKTKAVFLTHHLGSPSKLEEIADICKKHNLLLLEDCCDALGTSYNGKPVGSYGIASTFSFYPAHHITTGEGGMVVSKDPNFIKAVRSIRDWGRDCFCDSKCANANGTCGKRFTGKFGNLPEGYDHKYVYSEIGLNLKPLEFQAAMGLEQLKKLPDFIRKRKANFKRLNRFFQKYEHLFILPTPVNDKADISWFAYPLTIKTDQFTRHDIVTYLENAHIQTRHFFSGNILRHPLFYNNPAMKGKYSVYGNLKNSDTITERSFILGVYPGLTKEMMDYMINTLDKFLVKYKK